MIFGDGSQTRDFTWVEETARGIVAAAACDELVGEAVNIAFGRGVSIREVCDLLLDILGSDLEPELVEARPGDVEAHYADTTKARTVLGFEARIELREGLERYVEWARGEQDPLELVRTRASPQLVAPAPPPRSDYIPAWLADLDGVGIDSPRSRRVHRQPRGRLARWRRALRCVPSASREPWRIADLAVGNREPGSVGSAWPARVDAVAILAYEPPPLGRGSAAARARGQRGGRRRVCRSRAQARRLRELGGRLRPVPGRSAGRDRGAGADHAVQPGEARGGARPLGRDGGSRRPAPLDGLRPERARPPRGSGLHPCACAR